jgi:tetratricopeptide (TPR) repeat protein
MITVCSATLLPGQASPDRAVMAEESTHAAGGTLRTVPHGRLIRGVNGQTTTTVGTVADVYWKDPLERRIDELMARVTKAGDDQAKRAAAVEAYLRFAYAHEDEDYFDIGPWTEDLVDAYLALGRIEDAMKAVMKATQHGYSEAADMLCDLAEKLMRTGNVPKARTLWDTARADFPDDIWVYVQAGIEYSDLGDPATALSWLTTGMELALHIGDPESALEQLVPLRVACQLTLGHEPDDLQARAARELARQR